MFGIFKKRKSVHELSNEWWCSLTTEQVKEYELDFFDNNGGGDTTDIDIEAMYMTYVIEGGKSW